MPTDSPYPRAQPALTPRAPANGSPPSERPVRLEPAVERATPTSDAFSRVAVEHRLGAALDTLVERLPIGVAVVDRDGRVVYANAAARALRAERVAPLSWAVTRALLTEEVVREDEIELVTPDGTRRWLEVTVIPARSAGGGSHAAVLAIADDTVRRQVTQWRPVIESLMNL
jgi:PAS domain-containing protein